MLGEAEEHAALLVGLGNKGDDGLDGVAHHGSLKGLQQRTLLSIEVLHHDAQLGAVFGHKVCLTACELVAALADVIDVLGGELSHLGGASSREDILVHIVVGIGLRLLGSRHKPLGQRHLASLGIDGEQQSALVAVYLADADFLIQIEGKLLGRIGHTDGVHADVYHPIGLGGMERHVLLLHVAEGVHGKLSGGVGGLLYLDGKSQRRLGQKVSGSGHSLLGQGNAHAGKQHQRRKDILFHCVCYNLLLYCL